LRGVTRVCTSLTCQLRYGETSLGFATISATLAAFITSGLNGWNNIENGDMDEENAKEKCTQQEQDKTAVLSSHTKL